MPGYSPALHEVVTGLRFCVPRDYYFALNDDGMTTSIKQAIGVLR